MGLMKKIKDLLAAQREEKMRIESFLKMSADDLEKLSSEELYDAVSIRLESQLFHTAEEDERIASLNEAQRVFYVLNYYDMEVQNGGLCQFFVNSSRAAAPYVHQSLLAVGAKAHASLYQDFLDNNEISPDHLDSFDIFSVDEFQEQNKRYPFEEFDTAYYSLYETEILCDLVIDYTRKHIREFA